MAAAAAAAAAAQARGGGPAATASRPWTRSSKSPWRGSSGTCANASEGSVWGAEGGEGRGWRPAGGSRSIAAPDRPAMDAGAPGRGFSHARPGTRARGRGDRRFARAGGLGTRRTSGTWRAGWALGEPARRRGRRGQRGKRAQGVKALGVRDLRRRQRTHRREDARAVALAFAGARQAAPARESCWSLRGRLPSRSAPRGASLPIASRDRRNGRADARAPSAPPGVSGALAAVPAGTLGTRAGSRTGRRAPRRDARRDPARRAVAAGPPRPPATPRGVK